MVFQETILHFHVSSRECICHASGVNFLSQSVCMLLTDGIYSLAIGWSLLSIIWHEQKDIGGNLYHAES